MENPISILLLTYERTEYAIRTIRAAIEYLSGPPMRWYVADDGSAGEHYFEVMKTLEAENVFGSHNEKLGSGHSWNRGLDACFHEHDVVLYLEDDWELRKPLDLTPYVKLLRGKKEIGMVRLGHLAIDLDCYTVGHDGIHYLRIEKSTPYQYSGNPSLRHRRFHVTYGMYPTDKNPGETEIAFDGQVRSQDGPEVWWPVDLGGWGVFSHIGQEQSY